MEKESIIGNTHTPEKQSRANQRRTLWKMAAMQCEAKLREWASQGCLPPNRAEIIAKLIKDPDTGPLLEKLRPPGSAANWPSDKGMKYIVHHFDKHCPGIWAIKSHNK